MSDIYLDPSLVSFTTSEVVTASKLQSYVLDNVQSLKNGLVGDTSADTDVRHNHRNGTLANRPTAGNAGRIYYATDLGVTFIDNGSRWDPIGVNHRICDHFFDDFHGLPAIESPWDQIGSSGTFISQSSSRTSYWQFMANGNNAYAQIVLRSYISIFDYPGILTFKLGQNYSPRTQGRLFLGAVGASIGAPPSSEPSEGLYFEKIDTASEGSWTAVAADGTTKNKSIITGSQDSIFHLFEIVIKSSTSVEYYIDGNLKATLTTNLPTPTTEPLLPVMYIGSTVADARFLGIDFYESLKVRV